MIDPYALTTLALAATSAGLGHALRRARRDAREGEAKFRAVVDTMQEGIVVRDPEGRILAANRAGTEALGLSLDQFAGYAPTDAAWQTIREDGSPWPREAWPSHVAQREGRALRDQTMGVVMPWGETTWLSVSAVPLFREGERRPYQVVATFSDVTVRRRRDDRTRRQVEKANDANLALAEAYAQLVESVDKDGLTGLLVHRAFQERLADEARRSERYGRPLSLVLLDVDEFKAYNDRFGHPEGDEALRRVAQILKAAARGSDPVARYGGEEFTAILPDADEEGAALLAERLRAAVEGADWPLRPVTISLGVATLAPGETPGELVARADAALYRAKRGGRNRVARAEGGAERMAA